MRRRTRAATTAPSHHLRVLRPEDLVVLDVTGYGLRTVGEGADVAWEPEADDARLEVGFSYQHVHEAAEPEPNSPLPVPLSPVPVPVRAANGSRLVFDVPAGERIPVAVAGLLEAMSRLPLRVAPLALPRAMLRRFTPGAFADAVGVVTLPGGLRLLRGSDGLVLAPAAGAAAPAVSPRDLVRGAGALRTARTLLAQERAVDLTGLGRRGILDGPGGLTFDPPIVRPRRQQPRAPLPDETAIEAPFRLIVSPSVLEGFTHATTPRVVPPDPSRAHDPTRVELWHSRLGVRRVAEDGTVSIDETADPQKLVRAVWARDLEDPAPDPIMFLASLTAEDREALVRESADPALAPPQPVTADRLYLSSLGAWLDLHGRWDSAPYRHTDKIITAWDHEAASGRDYYVRVVEPYYFYPTGHRANLVTITERKVTTATNPQARLYQRKFLTLRDPVLTYDGRDWPFKQIRIRPSTTPNLDFQLPPPYPPNVAGQVGGHGDDLFWPMVDGGRFRFLLDCLDHEGRRVILRAPLLAVSETMESAAERADVETTYRGDPDRAVPGDGQVVALAPAAVPGDTAYEVVTLRLDGTAQVGTATPRLGDADLVVPAMQHLAPSAGPVTVSYADPYLADGFTGANQVGQVLLRLTTPASISFGGGTDRAGGFVQPDLPVEGLSRTIGIVGDITSVVSPTQPGLDFDPTKFLAGVLPKLFGLFDLTDVLALAGLDKAPRFVTEQLDRIAALLADLEDLVAGVDAAVTRLQDDAASAPTAVLQQQADQAHAAVAAVQAGVSQAVTDLTAALDTLMALDEPSDLATVTAAVAALLDDLSGFVGSLGTAVADLPMPASVKAPLERLVGALRPVLDAAAVADTIAGIADFVNGIDPASMTVRARFQWRPTMKNFPDGASDDQALFFVPDDGFLLSVEARASGAEGVGVDVLAELRDFGLNLFPGATLLTMRFDRLAFHAPAGRKPEVDVVFTGMQWQGILGFIETLQELIPFDGFSDPPYVDVAADGVTAGFDLALPNLAIGVFSLENISLGADVRVPFLGDALTVGFNFCTREKPFRLTVMAIGGGGFVGLRLSPKGLVMLEMALEAGASLSLDFGVASGSVSVMVGVYLRLEGDEGSLTGYFRIRGAVDVLGLISASITLELSLTYDFDTGKMVGRASITVEVEVLFFSASVQISCERQLAGSNGDPTLAQILGVPEDGTPLTHIPAAWSDYCGAFAGA
ncbi:MAG: hypothetical protein KDB63_12260 [Nocardioidaceae bacterium]|nr:hypothetical protein [Nocardioidaceae bacterium]